MLLIFLIILAVSIFFPGATITVLVINTALVLFFSTLQITVSLLPRLEPKRRTLTSDVFVSVIVPAYNEPPAILMETLEALSKLEYKNFEVVIIDNNTKDENIWKPVQKFAGMLGEKFRFFHTDKLDGFKAGALNYAMKFLNANSEYVAVIDADYVVEPEFLNTAMSYFTDDQIALVQFPQQYRNCNEKNRPVADEYRHFFKVYMNMANYMDCVPSTGTLSVYKLKVLESIGGFRGEALTEDADVGLHIYGAGYRGVYADRSIGYGLMPYDIEAYRKQKWRWAFGNAQSLETLFSLFGKIPLRSWLGFLAHLSAWEQLNFLPFAVLGAYSIVLFPAIPITALHRHLLDVASISIFITLLARLTLFIVAMKNQKKSLRRSIRAFIVHMGMTMLYSEAWLTFLLDSKYAFERTNKFILKKVPSLLKNSYKELILGIWFSIGALEAILWGTRSISIIAFSISALMLFSIYYTCWKISPTKAYSKKLISDLENKYRPCLPPPNNLK